MVRPGPKASITPQSPGRARPERRSSCRISKTVADEHGAFRFLDIAPGVFNLKIEDSERRLLSRNVTIGPDQHVELVVQAFPTSRTGEHRVVRIARVDIRFH